MRALGENYTNMTYKIEKLSSKLYIKSKYKKKLFIYTYVIESQCSEIYLRMYVFHFRVYHSPKVL